MEGHLAPRPEAHAKKMEQIMSFIIIFYFCIFAVFVGFFG